MEYATLLLLLTSEYERITNMSNSFVYCTNALNTFYKKVVCVSFITFLMIFLAEAKAQCPVISANPSVDTICSGNSVSISFNSDQPGTTYSWTAMQIDVVGATDAAGFTIGDTLTTVDVIPGSVVYTVTPVANGCTGTPIQVTVVVNPVPVVTAAPNPHSICTGGTTSIALSSTVAGTTFSWVVSQSGTSGASNGDGANIAQTLTTVNGGIATYNITPLANGCYGYSIYVPVNVRRRPTVSASPLSQTICSGSAIATINITNPNNIPGTTFSWVRDNTVNLTGIAGSGSGSSINGTLTNTTGTADTTVFTIIATASTCSSSTPMLASVVVDVAPNLVTNDQSVCAPATVDLTAPAVTAGSTAGLTFSYYTDSAATTPYSTPTTATAGTYYIVASTGLACADTAAVNVTISTSPTVVTTPQSVCAPATVDLTDSSVTTGSTPGLTFSYYTDAGATTVYPTPTTATSGTYYIVGTLGGSGCADTTPVVVTINTKPNLVTVPQSVCAPATTVDLTAAGVTAGSTLGLTYSYYTDAGATTIYPTPTAATAGTYYIVGTLGGSGCSDTASVTVTISPKPNLVTNNPTAVCSPATVDLTAPAVTSGSTPGGLTFSYYTDSAATSVYPTPTAATNGTYYIVGSIGGCSDTAAVTVTVTPSPTVLTTPQSACSPATVDLTDAVVTAGSTPGLTYSYYTDAAATMVYATPTAATAGTYYIVGTLGGACSDTTPVVVTIFSKPNLVINHPAAVCSPATVNLTSPAITVGSTPGLTYSYYTDSVATLPYATPTAATTGTYYIVGAVNGCSDTAAVNVTIVSKPTVVTVPQVICSPATSVDLTLSAVTAGSTPGLTYSYYTNASATIVYPTPATATVGTYYIVGTIIAGCTDTTAVTVTVNPTPTVITNNQIVCSPSTVDLTVSAVTLGSTGGLTYTYYTDSAATAVYATPTVATAGTYYIVGRTAAGCYDTAAVDVIVNPKPAVVTTPQAACFPATVNITLPAVTAGSTGGLTYTYYTDSAATNPFLTPTVATTGTYYIVGTSGAACSDTTPVTVTINPKPDVVTNNPAPVCSPATVDLTDSAITLGSTAGLTYSYYTNAAATLPYITPTTATSGTYYIVGSTLAGCSDTTAVTVTVFSKPLVNTVPQTGCNPPGTVNLTLAAVTAGSTLGLSYTYYTDSVATISYATPTTAGAGTYYIVGISPLSGCSDTASVTVTINPTPTVSITNPPDVCSPATVDLTDPSIVAGSTGGLTYGYFTDPAATNPVVMPGAIAVSGTYYIAGTIGGCRDVEAVTVTINPKPIVNTSPLALCLSVSIDLTDGQVTAGSTPGLSYTYFSDVTATTPVPDPSNVGAGTYYIVGETSDGCSDTAAVTVDSLPVVETDPIVRCYPDTTENLALAIAAGTTPGLTFAYFMDIACILQHPDPSTSEAGTYYVVGSTPDGCSDTASITFIVNPKPNVVTNNPDTLCSPSTVNLTAPAITAGSDLGLVYSYFTNATATIPYLTPATAGAGTYYIVGMNPSNCSDTASVVVVITPQPNLVTNDIAQCFPETLADLTDSAVTVGSDSGLVFNYFMNPAGTIPVPDPTSVAPGTYYIEASFMGGCTVIQPVLFSVNAKPTVVTNTQQICAPATIDLTDLAVTAGSTAGLTFGYYTDSAATIVYPTPTVADSGTYYIVGQTVAGCSDTTAVLADVQPAPTLITVPQTVCSPATTTDLTDSSVTLGSTPNLTFTYYTDPGITSLYGTPTAATPATYYIVGSTGAGCNDTNSVTFSINPKPTLITNPQSICTPDTTFDLTQAIVTTGSTPGLTLSYYSNANATVVYATPDSAPAGTYYIVGVTPQGCSDTSAITLTVNPKPVVFTNPPPNVCAPATADITLPAVTFGSTGSLTFSYYTDSAATAIYPTPTSATTGTYYIVGVTIAGCSDTTPVTVVSDSIPVVITTPQSICTPATTVDLTDSAVTIGSTSGITYSYYTDAAATLVYASPTAAIAGTYYIVGTTLGGCSDTTPVTVTVNLKPTVTTTDQITCTAPTIDITLPPVTAGSTPGLTYSYYTDSAATLIYPTPTVADSGTYYIVGTLAGCADTAAVNVTVNLVANVVTSQQSVCSPATSVDLTDSSVTTGSTPGLTYTYFTDSLATLVYPTPATAVTGTYYIVGTLSGGCADTASVEVIVGVTPTVLTLNQTICMPATTFDLTDTVVISGSTPGLTYSYYMDAAATTPVVTPTAVGPGFYYIVGTNGCSDTTQVTIMISPSPTVVTTDQSACSPATIADLTLPAVTMGSSLGLTFSYYSDSAATTVYPTPDSAIAGTYYIVGQAGSGCADTTAVDVIINPKPTVVTSPQSACAPATADITLPAVTTGSTSGLTFSYYTDSIATSVFATPTAAPAGTYYIVGETGDGCSDTTAVTVTINTAPVLVITDPAAVCAPATIDITDSAITLGSTLGLTFSYYSDSAATILYPTPITADSGTYYIVGTLSGCADTAAVNVTIYPKPVVNTIPQSLCLAASVDLTSSAVTMGSTSGLTFSYYTDAAATLTYTTPDSATSGTYYIVGVSGNGCFDTASVDVTLQPTVLTTPQVVCLPGTVDLTDSLVTLGSSGGLIFTYYTNDSATNVYPTPTTATGPATYYIVGTTLDGCSDTTAVVVTSAPKPTVSTVPQSVCMPTTTVNLTAASVTLGSTSGLTYTYYTDSAATIAYTTPTAATSGTYYIVGTTLSGCTDTAAVTVTVNPKPNLVTTNPPAVCSPLRVDLTDSAVTTGSSPGMTLLYFTNSFFPYFTPSSATAGTYNIIGITLAGCRDTASVVVTIVASPTVVTVPQVSCLSGTTDLTDPSVTTGSTSGLTYSYYTDSAAIVVYPTPMAADSGTYYIVGTNGTCSDTTPVVVLTNVVPSIVTTPQSACEPLSVDLTDTAVTTGSTLGLTFSYYTDSLATIPYLTPTAADSGTYYIVGTIGGGCSDTASVTVTINPKPVVLVTNPSAVCMPATVDITAPTVTTGSTSGLTFSYYTDSLATLTHPTPTTSATGIYYIVGSTLQGCSDTTAVTVTIDSLPTVVTTAQFACAPATVDLTLSGVTSGSTSGLTLAYYTDSLATVPYPTPTVADSGVYYIVGTSLAGCADTTSVLVVIDSAPTLVITNPLPACAPAAIDLTDSTIFAGSTAGLTYTYYTDSAATILVASPTAVTDSGTYYIVGTSLAGCSDTAAVTLTIYTKPMVATVAQAICEPDSVMDITLPAVTAGSTAGLTFSYYTDSAATIVYTTPDSAIAGTYYIVGTNLAGCTDTTAVIVTVNPKPVVVTVNPAAVCAPSTVNLTDSAVTVGSTAGLTFSYYTDSAATTVYATPNSATAGIYYIVGTSLAGCSDTAAVTVTVNAAPSVAVSSNNLSCFASCDGSAIATASGGNPFYTYSWSSGQVTDSTYLLTDSIGGLCAGGYTLTVTDSNGCVAIDSIALTEPAQINANITTTNTNCNSVCNGAAVVHPSAGIPPYTYAWSTGAVDTMVTGLCSGTYTVIVTDSAGCNSATPFTILPAPDVLSNAVITNANCGECNGQVTLAPSGGAAPYTFLWGDGDTANTQNNLCAGLHSVTVTDSTGCVTNFFIPISNPGGVTDVAITSTNVSCFGLCDGSVTAVTPIGGAAPYSYLWIPSGETTPTIDSLCAGTYYLQVEDSSGCSVIDTVIITQPAQMNVNPFVASPTCGNCNGSIIIVPSGGIAPYAVSWNTGATSDTLASLCAGLYTVQVTDSAGCSQSLILPVSNQNGPALSMSSTPPTCNNDCNGTATVVATGGTTPYSYLWNDPAAQSGSTANGLCSGTYFVQVTGGTCVSIAQVTLLNPNAIGFGFPLTDNPSCNGSNDGSIIVVPAGGTLPYTYSWTSGGNGAIEDSLSAGNYTVTVTDANGCTGTLSSTLTEPAIMTLSDTIINASCNTIPDGAIDITVAGGTPGYTYQWSGTDTASTQDMTSAYSGTYTVVVTDANGCALADTFDILSAVTVLANAGNDTAFCMPGMAILDASGSTSNSVNYQWYQVLLPTDTLIGTGVNTSVNAVTGATAYYVIADNGAGCAHRDTVYVTGNPPPPVDAGVDTDVLAGSSAVLGGNPTGPSGSTYVWNPSADLSDATNSNPTATPLVTTSYTVTVTSPDGCVSSDVVIVSVAGEIKFPNGISPNGDGANDTWIIDGINLFPDCVVEIYNRWGELLFQSKGYTQPWDGRYKGKELPVGTYYYIINLNHPLFPDAYTGPITILR